MLALEWILLISLLVIGIIGGLAVVRDALLCELQDVANCIQALNCCTTCVSPCGPPSCFPCGCPSPCNPPPPPP
jgi:hypothetical protein